jgi:hypothetical protein
MQSPQRFLSDTRFGQSIKRTNEPAKVFRRPLNPLIEMSTAKRQSNDPRNSPVKAFYRQIDSFERPPSAQAAR